MRSTKGCLQQEEGGILAKDGYQAYNVIAVEETQALTKSIVNYAKWASRTEAQVDALQAQLDAMAMQQ